MGYEDDEIGATDMTRIFPAVGFPPGGFILDELAEREWTYQDLAEHSGLHVSTIRKVIVGDRSIGEDIATALAVAFGTSDRLWLNLQASYNRSKQT